MVEFGKKLQEECRRHGSDWHTHCIDYGVLKKILKSASSTLNTKAISNIAPPNFQPSMDQEIEKAVLFLLQEQGRIAAELARLTEQRATCIDNVGVLLQEYRRDEGFALSGSESLNLARDELRKNHTECQAASQSILSFIAFVELNVTAVRKILKKHDKTHPRHKLSQNYLSSYTSGMVDSHLEQLYHYGGLSALVATLKRAFEELHRLDMILQMMTRKEKNGSNQSGRLVPYGASIQENPSSTSLSLEEPITNEREPMLDQIHAARKRLKQSTKYVDVIAAQALMFDDRSDEYSLEDQSEMTKAQQFSSFLNLCSTFLYMANYYIIAPTCGQYASVLGSDESMAGIIIGMTPIAALIATVLYGWWSNHSYKNALIFAAVCSLLGNLCYALALQYNSLHMVLLGRFLNGFGSARAINRRFIADAFRRSDRTAASVAYVTAGASGMAMGPAIASLLGSVEFPLDGVLWTLQTSPGWIMLGMWSAFLAATVVFFKEPDRSHVFGKTTSVKPTSDKSGENKPLLLKEPSFFTEDDAKADSPIYANVPVMMTLWIYFILKLVLECLMSSSATLTSFYFGWDAQFSGAFLAFLGLLVFPANMIVARLCYRYDDRELIYATLIAMFCSILGIIAYKPGSYSVVHYVLFGICVFLSTSVLEGPNMSLLSKTIPLSWAKGTFNSGFLATEAGTLARSVGDLMISAVASGLGISALLNAIFLPLLVLVLLSVLLSHNFYNRLIDDDDDDDFIGVERSSSKTSLNSGK